MNYEIRSNDNYEEIIFNDEVIEKVSGYWTEYRMENAIPIEAISAASVSGTAVSENTEMRGAAVPIDADTSVSPFDAGGKLFLTMNGKDYYCSAQFCGDDFLVLTAAHCVRDAVSGEWAENIFFVRAYKDLSHQQTFPVKAAVVNKNWNSDVNARLDYAFVITAKRSDVSPLPYKTDVNNADVTAFGYPQNFGGGYAMKRADGPTSLEQNDLVLMQGNLMKGGATGGAWVEQGGNTVVGLSAFSSQNSTEHIYSPQFTSDFDNLADYAKELMQDSVKVTDVRYFTLLNKGGFVVQIQIKWTAPNGDSGTFEESGYHDICIHGERTLDLTTTKIPDGSKVRLNANVVGGKDNLAPEEFTYKTHSAAMANYKISGATLTNKLVLLSCQ